MIGDKKYTSSPGYAVFIPFALAALALLALAATVKAGMDGDAKGALTMFLTASLFAWALSRCWNRFADVTVDRHVILVTTKSHQQSYGWNEVRSFHSVWFATPTIYWFTFTTNPRPIFFVPRSSITVSVPFWNFHLQGMGRFIREQLDRVERSATRSRPI